MKTPQERGALGHWLREQRLKRGYDTAAKLHAALTRARIYVNLPDYRSLESGAKTRAPDGFLDALATFYGTPPPDMNASPQGISELVDALNRQTAMMEQLVMKLDGLASSAVRDGVQAALRELALLQNAEGQPPSQLPSPQP